MKPRPILTRYGCLDESLRTRPGGSSTRTAPARPCGTVARLCASSCTESPDTRQSRPSRRRTPPNRSRHRTCPPITRSASATTGLWRANCSMPATSTPRGSRSPWTARPAWLTCARPSGRPKPSPRAHDRRHRRQAVSLVLSHTVRPLCQSEPMPAHVIRNPTQGDLSAVVSPWPAEHSWPWEARLEPLPARLGNLRGPAGPIRRRDATAERRHDGTERDELASSCRIAVTRN